MLFRFVNEIAPPIVKVQVRARPNTSSGPGDVRELAGLVNQDERGIFVSTGGFTRDAKTDGNRTRTQLIGMDRLVELLLENHDKLDQDTKTLVPPRRLYVP